MLPLMVRLSPDMMHLENSVRLKKPELWTVMHSERRVLMSAAWGRVRGIFQGAPTSGLENTSMHSLGNFWHNPSVVVTVLALMVGLHGPSLDQARRSIASLNNLGNISFEFLTNSS